MIAEAFGGIMDVPIMQDGESVDEIATPAVRNLIRESKTHQVNSMIQTGKKYGMQLLDEAIMDLFNKGWISGDAAYQKANDKAKFRPLLKEPPSDFTEA